MLGSKLASKISVGTHNINHYLQKIPRNVSSLLMKHTTIGKVIKTTDSLPNKTSHGHYGISNTLLKMLKHTYSFPTHPYLQSIN